MAIKRVKKKEHELLSETNVAKVIRLLESNEPITKKEACEILNISYNTTRLNNIIESHKSKKEVDKKLRDANRGKPASNEEIASIIEDYLHGESIAPIAKRLHRSCSFVSNIVKRVGIPERLPKKEQVKPSILPDSCVSEFFEKGEIVWSAKYHAPCEIQDELVNPKYEEIYSCKCYSIYVFEDIKDTGDVVHNIKKGGFNAYSPAYNLGSLKHLYDYNINIKEI